VRERRRDVRHARQMRAMREHNRLEKSKFNSHK